ncbi:MAG: HXXEE domain-containing protein [Promethearchaeota archaeon]
MNESRIKNFFNNFTFKKMIWFAPVLYFFHILEEALFGFYIFINEPFESFLLMNIVLMIVYIFAISLFTLYSNRVTAFFALGGLVAAQFYNAFFHLYMTIIYRAYCPGIVSGFALYIPFVLILSWKAYREEYITKTTAIILYIIGAILMTLFEVEGLNIVVLFGWEAIYITSTIIYYLRNSKKKTT